MNLTHLSSIVLVIALVAIPQLVIYFDTRENKTSVEPEYEHDYR